MHSVVRLRKTSTSSHHLSLSLRRSIHTSTRLHHPLPLPLPLPHNNDTHNAESYFKDVDETPPQDPTIHRVDAASEAAQRPYEPPSGQWSQAGVRTSEYEHVDRHDVPYDVAGGLAKENLNLGYGGTERYASSDKGPIETSRIGEGPEGRTSEGLK